MALVAVVCAADGIDSLSDWDSELRRLASLVAAGKKLLLLLLFL